MFRLFGTRRRELLEAPLPAEWLGYLHDNVFLYRLLAEDEQARLWGGVTVLVDELNWEGCSGLHMTDEVRVTVAAQAALLLLGFDGYFFDDVQSVLVYPGGFLAGDPGGSWLHHRLG